MVYYIVSTIVCVDVLAIESMIRRKQVYDNGWTELYSIDDIELFIACLIPIYRVIGLTGCMLLNRLKAKHKRGNVTLHHDDNVYLGYDEHIHVYGKVI